MFRPSITSFQQMPSLVTIHMAVNAALPCLFRSRSVHLEALSAVRGIAAEVESDLVCESTRQRENAISNVLCCCRRSEQRREESFK